MQSKIVGDLVHLSARSAVAHHFDSGNYRIMRWLLVIAIPCALAAGLVDLGEGRLWSRLA